MSGTALKLTALILMLADHAGQFLPDMPLWLRWLGRSSAPIFLFCSVHGLTHTRSRSKYLLRLYLLGIITALAELICTIAVPRSDLVFRSNIFVSLLIVGIIVTLAETEKRRLTVAAAFIVWELAACFLCMLAENTALYGLLTALTLPLSCCEGSFFFVGTGVCMYFLRSDTKKLAAAYILLSLVQLIAALLTGDILVNCQWMMIFALPLMLSYNGRRGAGLKYLFYIFYPAHLVLLYLLGAML